MTLEDFERALAERKQGADGKDLVPSVEPAKKRRKHSHKDRHDQMKGSNHANEDRVHTFKPRKHRSTEEGTRKGESIPSKAYEASGDEEWVEKEVTVANNPTALTVHPPKRDSWMEAPSSSNFEYRRRNAVQQNQLTAAKFIEGRSEAVVDVNEVKNSVYEDRTRNLEVQGMEIDIDVNPAVDYSFGDAGSQWRMTKLKAVLRKAKESGRRVEEVAAEQYGNLRAFDDAREEQLELERRCIYGRDYAKREKPSGERFRERTADASLDRDAAATKVQDGGYEPGSPRIKPRHSIKPLDQTALNRMKAQMIKAKLRGSPGASSLEAAYNDAASLFESQNADKTIVLGVMHDRMLAGGPTATVSNNATKREQERYRTEENEDMSIEDMIREERRTRLQAGGEGRRFAEQIAKDTKFDDNLDYLDENASKLAKRILKSDINLKNASIAEFKKLNRVLDNCALCYREDQSTPPIAPVVSLATRAYLTLPTQPEISEGGASIIPLQHRTNLLECDDDEWEEIRNFMKCLTRMYHDQGRDVIFYENAAAPQRKKHAGMEAVPLPYSLGKTASAFFKEAILSADEEWSQHRKIIDTLSKARQGLGKSAFRRTLVKEMPYFHVWLEIDGGLGHVVEDGNRWPKGDLFARSVIGGMLDQEPSVIRTQGRWTRGNDQRVDAFRKRWKKFDWTRALTDEGTSN